MKVKKVKEETVENKRSYQDAIVELLGDISEYLRNTNESMEVIREKICQLEEIETCKSKCGQYANYNVHDERRRHHGSCRQGDTVKNEW
jgi:hypothetical protein